VRKRGDWPVDSVNYGDRRPSGGGAGVLLFSYKGASVQQSWWCRRLHCRQLIDGARAGSDRLQPKRLGKKLEQPGDVAVKGATERPPPPPMLSWPIAQRQIQGCASGHPALVLLASPCLNSVEGEQKAHQTRCCPAAVHTRAAKLLGVGQR